MKNLSRSFGRLTVVDKISFNIQVIIALLSMCVIFFATEAVPLPAVALSIGLVQLFFGVTEPSKIVSTYAHDAVWFIAGSLALGATFIKYGIDKRIGMLVLSLSGTNIRRIVIGLLIGTSIPAAFIGEHAVAGMYLPIAVALFTLTSKDINCPNLGKLLTLTIAFGCMMGGPMSPTGGARNAIMIGYFSEFNIAKISYWDWIKYAYPMMLIEIPIASSILWLTFKPKKRILDSAVRKLKVSVAKDGKLSSNQVMSIVIFIFTIMELIK